MKYELTSNKKTYNRITLTQIRALKDIPAIGVNKGDLGGLIESESNLSQADYAWVSDNAKVFGNAEVLGNAKVFGGAFVYGNAKVFGNAWVSGNAKVFGDALVLSDDLAHDNLEINK